MKNTFWCLIIIYISVYNVQGDDRSCSETSWNAFACIQYLQRSLAELQDQIKLQSVHLENLSVRLDNQSLQLENQAAQLESQSGKLTTLSDLSSTQSIQLEIISSQMVTLSTVVTAQSVQLTNHSSELIRLFENSTSQSVQLATNSVKLDDQSAQLQSQSSQLTTHSTQLSTQSALLEGLQNNSIPIGFIYVQLPSQSPPYSLWPAASWQDVTFDYAGLFFRVLGGNSESFETIQSENSPRITEVQTVGVFDHLYHNYIYPNNQFSAGVASGDWTGNGHWTLRFKQSEGEVRPRNTAVRIWKRMN